MSTFTPPRARSRSLPLRRAAAAAALFFGAALAPAFAYAETIDLWWPADGARVSGVQPFKAMLQSHAVADYSMTWSVDGGDPVPMYDSWEDYPHDEAIVDVSGWSWRGEGPYVLTFTAKSASGATLGTRTSSIYVSQPAAAAEMPAPEVKNPLDGLPLYVDPATPAAERARSWQSSRPADAALMAKIASNPVARWFGNWNADVRADADRYVAAAADAGAMPVLVAYNIPQRDCGSYSAGGSNSADAYKRWVRSLAEGIGDREAAVILEPDALPQMDCLSAADQETRVSLISYAVETLKAKEGVAVYVDAGNSGWKSADDIAARLRKASIAKADGFSLNVSGFVSTEESARYGEEVSGKAGGARFVIDTSRNGNGSTAEWCNPSGRALGQKPTTATGSALADAYLWVKVPGESDGTCNGGPSAGTFWDDYALGLARLASW
jgi:endoglucanase